MTVKRGPNHDSGPGSKPASVPAAGPTIWEFTAGDDPRRVAS